MERVEGYTVVYRQAEDVILAEVPAIPGCFSDGRTLEEARERVQDAILNFLKDLEQAGEAIPSDVLHSERIPLGAAPIHLTPEEEEELLAAVEEIRQGQFVD